MKYNLNFKGEVFYDQSCFHTNVFLIISFFRLYENTKTVTKSLEEESSPLSVSRSSSVTSLNLAGVKKLEETSSSITSALVSLLYSRFAI